MEAVREYMAQKRYAEAARSAETAVMLRPENAGAWYSLAVAQADYRVVFAGRTGSQSSQKRASATAAPAIR